MTIVKEKNMEASFKEFKEMVVEAMEAKKVSTRDLAGQLGTTYEYTRMIVAGSRDPAPHTLRSICRLLDINYVEAERSYRLKKLHTNMPEIVSLFPTDLQEIILAWDGFSDSQKKALQGAVSEWTKKP